MHSASNAHSPNVVYIQIKHVCHYLWNLSYLQSSSGWKLALRDGRTVHWIYMYWESTSIYISNRITVIALPSTSNLKGSYGSCATGQNLRREDHTSEIKDLLHPPTTLTAINPQLLRWTSSGVKSSSDMALSSISARLWPRGPIEQQVPFAFSRCKFCGLNE